MPVVRLRLPLARLIVVTAALAVGGTVRAEQINVTTIEDELNADGDCSLREAIRAANTDAAVDACRAGSGADEIVVPGGTYTLSVDGRGEDDGASGDLDVTGDVTITGAGAGQTIIQACAPESPEIACTGIDRVFHVDPRATGISAAISGVTIQKGQTTGIPFVSAHGGGILIGVPYTLGEIPPSGTLTLTDCVVRGNRNSIPGFVSAGGGIANRRGTLTLVHTTVRENDGPNGGGIYNEGMLNVVASWIRNNSAGEGAGIWVAFGDVAITDTTVSGNESGGFGAGISNYRGTVRISNSTISGNHTTSSGAGVFNNQGTVIVNGSTIAANRAGIPEAGGQGPGILTYAAVTVSNTIIAGNLSTATPLDCSGTLTSGGYNLIQAIGFPQSVPQCFIAGDATGDVIGQDARLGLLIDNGGSTRTHALLAGSPAIDAGSPDAPGSTATACPAVDQRGVPRPQGARCDIGAFELAGGFSVSGITPDAAGSGGPLVAIIYGSGFAPGASLQLARSGAAPIGSDSVGIDDSGSVAVATFDLTGQPAGRRDLIVTNPDGRSVARSDALTIEDPRAADVWVDLIGRDIIRVGRPARFRMIFGNRGNVDAAAVPLVLGVPSAIAFQMLTPITPPPAPDGEPPVDWSNVPIDVLSGERGDFIIIPLILPVVPVGFTGQLEFAITAPPELHGQELELLAGIGDAYFRPALDADELDALTDGAIAYARRALGAEIPPARRPALQTYVSEQLQRVAERGRAAWLASTATAGEVYSLPQVATDFALFGRGAAPTPAAASAGARIGGPAGTFGRQECTDMGFKVVANRCVPKQCRGIGAPPCNGRPVFPRRSIDPNDKHGALGVGEPHYLAADLPLRYAVFFENLESAGLPAQEVVITDQLDTATLDVGSVSLGPIEFGTTTIVPPPGLRAFTRDVDLRPDRHLVVRIAAALDAASGVLTWHFTSLDPDTGEPPEDPLAGFLPPNVEAPEGEGSVFFTVALQPGLASGTEVRNRAAIVFDVNDPLETPEWRNTLDTTPPASQVEPLPATVTSPDFEVRWSGSDTDSGIATYTVEVAEDGGAFHPWLQDVADTAATLSGRAGTAYAFRSSARDRAGNSEAAPATADTATRVAVCAGDCDGDGTVKINELITGVSIALGNATLVCDALDTDGDHAVRINELVAAVDRALRGCGANALGYQRSVTIR